MDMHHIISDAVSNETFTQEFNQLIEGNELQPLDRQYKDYSEWFKNQDLSGAENYWIESLQNYPVLELTTDFPRPSDRQYSGAAEVLTLDETTTKKVKQLIQKYNATEYMFFLGLISVLLGKLANQEELVIGTAISGRIHKDTEMMLGMFVNTLALRVSPLGEKSFSDYLEELKVQMLVAQDHQAYPFEDLVEKIVKNRDQTRNPLFDVMMVYQNTEELVPVLDETSGRMFDVPAKFDLGFTLSDDGKQTYISLNHATSLFKAETIKAYLKRMMQLLDQILTDETQPIYKLNVLLEEEQIALVSDTANIYQEYPKDRTIVALFEEQVRKNSGCPGVIYKEKVLTYEELNKRANQVAHYLLKAYDIQPEDKIGLLLDRSEWMIISILGVLKSGAAYVPISPEYPQERMAYIEETAELKTTLVETQYEACMKKSIVVQNLKWDELPITNPRTMLKSDNLAYIIFTSGTTGRPKGVMIEHHQVNNLIPAMRQNHGLKTEGERLLFCTNYVFDPSVEQIFLALLSGYPLVVSPDQLWMDQEKFTAYLNQHKVTYIHMTPSLLLQINLTAVPTLKYVVSGGESVTSQLLEKVRMKDFRFINLYGPTEATVNTTAHLVDLNEKRNIIGHPLMNISIYVLDSFKQLVPRGTIGELYVGGVQVSRGYVNQPELTQERFTRNPFQTDGQKEEGWNDRLYQTGDLVRMLEDGTLEYHGRSDFQVKIRGYRIELGEIEHALLQIPGINQVHVKALGKEGNQYLGAYYVSNEEISQDVLDKELARYLPNYMIPSGYQHMSEFPLTINGKLDHRELPKIGFGSSAEYIAPQTLMEKLVAESYAEVLGLQNVSRHDNFFLLGGHSLRALRLVNLLEEKTDKAIKVKHIFSAPQVSLLAGLLDGLGNKKYERIPKATEKSVYEMSSTQKRMYLLWKLMPNDKVYNMPAMFQLEELDESKIQVAFTKLSERHEILRTTFHEQEGNFVQIISENVLVEVIGEKVAEESLVTWYEEAIQPFDLETGPMYRIKIVKTEKADYLFVDMHHIISDGVSNAIFIQEINQLITGNELPPLDLQYKDYSEWFKVQDMQEAEKYWVESLQDYPMLELPIDFARPSEQQYSGVTEALVLDETATKKIKQLIQRLGVTEYMFFLGLISVLLGKLSNQEEVVIGSPVSGRIHKDTESMLGMFVNTLAMRVSPSGNKSFSDYLEELKAQTLLAQEYQAYPFEDLVDQVVENRDRSRNPLFDVMMVYQNNEKLVPLLEDTDRWQMSVGIAKFDLSFTLSDDGKQTYLSLNYATALFKSETIKIYLERFQHLLNQVLADEQQFISELDILLAEERAKLLSGIGMNYHAYPNDKTIVELFEDQVKKRPNDLAVIFKENNLTYKELNEFANQVAHYLIETYKVQPEDKIGLLLDRSEWMIISILGVLKSGVAYVPISPEYPQDRIAYIEVTAELKTTIVEAGYETYVKESTSIDEILTQELSTSNPRTKLKPNHLAYILFTSGTTGKPKGVMIEHHQVNNLIPALRQAYGFEAEGEVLLFFSNYVFDVSIEQIFLALLNGDPLVVMPDQLWMDQEQFTAYLNEHRVTYVHMTPSLLSQIDLSTITSLRRVISAGESINSSLIKDISKYGIAVFNGYGPTEATVITTTHLFNSTEERNIIGRPLVNTPIYILDQEKRPLPIGTIGELYIGGVQVARGYVNQPELTQEKFIKNPFQTNKQKEEGWNDRLYQTGDLVRMHEDGTMEYHGRNDFQIKIRGYRIELGEIEQALLQVSGISQACAMVLGEISSQYLGAYYVSDEEIAREILDSELSSRLPKYMVPANYQHMSEFPLTVSGKLDHRALPNLEIDYEESYLAPTNQVEHKITAAYAQVLNLNPALISVKHNFFQLGGNSINLLKVITLLAKDFDIFIEDFYSELSISELANLIINKSSERVANLKDFQLTSGELFDKDFADEEKNLLEYQKSLNELESITLDKHSSRKNILITGITGFLGAHLLMELLQTTNHMIYAIVRGESDLDILSRVAKILNFYFDHHVLEKYSSRINIYKGDISEIDLGLDKNHYALITKEIDVIVNTASNVKHYGKYEDFHKANVLGVKNLIELQKVGINKHFIHCSTISLGSGYIKNFETFSYTEDTLSLPINYESVYLKTKAEAEELLFESRALGLTNSIVRLGNLQASTQTGRFQINALDNAFFSQINGFLKLGIVPDIDYQLDYTPINQAAEACVKLITVSLSSNAIYHIYNPHPLTLKDLLVGFSVGRELEFIPVEQFYSLLFDMIQKDEIDDDILRLSLHLGIFKAATVKTKFNIYSERTNTILKKLNFEWEKIEKDFLSKAARKLL